MPMKASLQRPGRPREGIQFDSWGTFLAPSSLGGDGFSHRLWCSKSRAGHPGMDCEEASLRSLRALRTQLRSICRQRNVAPSGFASSSRFKLTSSWEQVLRPFT